MRANPSRVSALAIGAFVLLSAGIPNVARAEADGPDFWRVRGVSADDVLNLRREPSASAKIVGTIPHDARGLKNLGCQGGPTFAEWSKMTPSERKKAAERRWCRIEFKGTPGWVLGKFLSE